MRATTWKFTPEAAAGTMKTMIRTLRAIVLTALVIVPCFATAGFAEWEIKTPGGNLISHVDPFIAANGTCLRSARPEKIYVAHLDWWRYYRNALVGKAKNGFFIFNETSHAVSFFASERLDVMRSMPGKFSMPLSIGRLKRWLMKCHRKRFTNG